MTNKRELPLLPILKLMRLHQWSKNSLVFIPLLTAHKITDIYALKNLVVAFFAFSFCASAVYILNDLIDLEHDRKHPIKKYRPFAVGAVSPKAGFILVPLLLALSALSGFWVRTESLVILCVYFLVTCAYSIWFKKITNVDCMVLAILYTLRIVSGAVVVQVPLSFWLLTTSFFIFLSLANLKRYTELQLQSNLGALELVGRGYTNSDKSLVRTFGICSGYTSTMVLALYLQGETVTILYSQPGFIWMTVPLFLLWINHLWTKADRGELQVDPLDFALRDKSSIFLCLMILMCFLFATNGIIIK